AGHKIVDLSGAYRLHNQEIFEKHYGLKHTSFELMKEAVFGMPEIFREQIKHASLIANPGCYPTAAILPLFLIKKWIGEAASITVNAGSGVSGAGGRTEDAGFSFNSVYENFRAYKILRHQHEPEIREYSLSESQKKEIPLVFTPHLLPLFRGILSTTVIHWKEKTPDGLKEALKDASAKEAFIRTMDEPEEVQLLRVQKTNFADMGIRSTDKSTVIVSAIDNLQKGAAGQAVQNMNLICGINETEGLLIHS
ncbi:MAG: N-acetyl-gamma-glutamyl-phosphate reductase, partial [Spirochaetia bacterium]|nr:N-acetyl-gamma-glutamyl-phosphate reductase [Spirochaetia bacterium]